MRDFFGFSQRCNSLCKEREINISDDEEWTKSKKEVFGEKDVSLHKTEIFVAVIPVKEKKRKLSLSQESIQGN